MSLSRPVPGDGASCDCYAGSEQSALHRLSPEHRTVLVLKDIDGQKYETMAEILSVPVGTIRSRLHRARLELREILERDEE